jgi:hypothetical protein
VGTNVGKRRGFAGAAFAAKPDASTNRTQVSTKSPRTVFVCWTSGLLLTQGQAQAQARPVVVTTFHLGRGHHPSSLCVLCHVKGSKPLLRQVCVTVLSPGSWCSVAARASVLSPERVCSTLKDLGRRNRTWRNGLKRWSSISPQSIFAHTPL